MTTSESKGRFFLQNESIRITIQIANWNALELYTVWLATDEESRCQFPASALTLSVGQGNK